MDLNFFDRFPKFYETAKASRSPARLNIRHIGLIQKQVEFIEGKTILDLTSHDGRWSFAALQAGASQVIGIEGRKELVDSAEANFQSYGVSGKSYRFIHGDVFDGLKTLQSPVDTIFCFGFFYHTLNHVQLVSEMVRLNPESIILDTRVSTIQEAVVEISLDDSSIRSHALSASHTRVNKTFVGTPSTAAINNIFTHFKYSASELDWSEFLIPDPSLKDYMKGVRKTFILRRE